MLQDDFHREVLGELAEIKAWIIRHDAYCRGRDEKITRLEEQVKARTGWGAVAVVVSYVLSALGFTGNMPGGGK
jgi:hypothetical protein